MKTHHLFISALIAFIPSLAMADECTAKIAANDAMQYDKKEITINKTCKKFTVTLTHTGTAAKTTMGHNWVLSKSEDAQAIATDGISAGIDNNYLKAGDTRVIASTKVIGGGESTSVDIPLNKLTKGGSYAFFCSFPGHIAVMKGTLKFE